MWNVDELIADARFIYPPTIFTCLGQRVKFPPPPQEKKNMRRYLLHKNRYILLIESQALPCINSQAQEKSSNNFKKVQKARGKWH